VNVKTVTILICILWLVCACGAHQPVSVAAPAAAIHRILFLGNSITANGPSPAIGWTGNWGMAASEASKDYVHQFAARLGVVDHTEVTLYAFETDFRNYKLDSIEGYLQQQPDIIIVQLGDNVSDATGFAQYYPALIDRLGTHGNPLIICTSTWWPSPVLNEQIRNICSKPDRRFVDISHLYLDATNIASSERTFTNAGVSSHPGDKGMEAIADALYRALP
jgi:lysophospholipase L1-like esterase